MPDEQINTRELYEIEKMKIELEKLKSPWYKKTGNWHLIISTFFALGTLFLLIKIGAFDLSAKEMESRRTNLQNDIKKYSNQKAVLQDAIDSMLTRINVLLDINDSMSSTLKYYEAEIDKDLLTIQRITEMTDRQAARLDSVMKLHKKPKKRRR